MAPDRIPTSVAAARAGTKPIIATTTITKRRMPIKGAERLPKCVIALRHAIPPSVNPLSPANLRCAAACILRDSPRPVSLIRLASLALCERKVQENGHRANAQGAVMAFGVTTSRFGLGGEG